MPKQQRLSGSAIRRIIPEKRLNSALFSLVIAKTEGKSALACTVSKKVSTKAVVRNRIKRRMRAAMQSHLPFPKETSYVLIAKRSVADADFAAIASDVADLMRRAGSVR